jgi:hypothetical protein
MQGCRDSLVDEEMPRPWRGLMPINAKAVAGWMDDHGSKRRVTFSPVEQTG